MKKIAVTAMALTIFFVLASLSFAANEFQIKGVVTKIDGNQVFIKDDKGKEIRVESNVTGIKVGDSILLKGNLFSTRTKLTPQDVEFLTQKCLIDQADVTVISQLEEQVRINLMSWTDKRNCKLFDSFKASRAYYRQLKPNTKLPLPPAGWDSHYLTDDEFQKYSDILANAPW